MLYQKYIYKMHAYLPMYETAMDSSQMMSYVGNANATQSICDIKSAWYWNMPHEYFCLSVCIYGSMCFFFICTASVLYGCGTAVCEMRICEILINLFGL